MSTLLSSALSSSPSLVDTSQSMSDAVTASTNSSRWNEVKKPPYQIDQQVKFLHLEAEVESLLQQLQRMKQQRETTVSTNSVDSQKAN